MSLKYFQFLFLSAALLSIPVPNHSEPGVKGGFRSPGFLRGNRLPIEEGYGLVLAGAIEIPN